MEYENMEKKIEAGEKTMLYYDTFKPRETEDIMNMDVERTLEFVLHMTRFPEYENNMDAFRKQIINMISLVHGCNMDSVRLYFQEHIKTAEGD